MELGFLGGSRPRNLSFPPATRASERVDEREARSMSPIPMSALLAGPAAGSSPTAATSVAAAADAATSAAAVAATAAETFAAAHRERLRHGRDYSWSDLALNEAAQTAAAASAAAEAAVAAATAAARRPAAGIHPEILRCVEGLKTKLVNHARVQPGKVRQRAAAQAVVAQAKRRLGGAVVPHAKRLKPSWGRHDRWTSRALLRRERRAVQKVELGTTWLRPQIDRLTELLATRTMAGLLPDGDYSERQLDRVTQQALILRRYYELHEAALQSGDSFETYDLAAQAGSSLAPVVSYDHHSVRRWHAQYVAKGSRSEKGPCLHPRAQLARRAHWTMEGHGANRSTRTRALRPTPRERHQAKAFGEDILSRLITVVPPAELAPPQQPASGPPGAVASEGRRRAPRDGRLLHGKAYTLAHHLQNRGLGR